jgi:hypothetical protein
VAAGLAAGFFAGAFLAGSALTDPEHTRLPTYPFLFRANHGDFLAKR